MRLLLTIQYKGTNFCGWQIQPNCRTVQQTLAEAIFEVTGETVTLHASGRTDAGVHALGQRVHFDSNTKIPPEKLPFALNTKLPDDLKVVACEQVADDLNARFNVKRKTYIYKFYCSPHENPMLFDGYAHLPISPDYQKMRAAADIIEGEHDFRCCQATGGHVKTTVRTVYSIDIKKDGELYEVAVTGNGFLYNMVRIITGTIYYAGIGRISEADIKTAFETNDRTKMGITLEAKGLYLVKVEY